MRKIYPLESRLLIPAVILLLALASCKKDNKNVGTNSDNNQAPATPSTLGLYGVDSAQYKELDIAISQIGTQTVDYGLVFDTGSGGMVIDANGIIPASMITSNGFNFSTDSTTVNGITITNQTTTLEYGVDNNSITKVYGNLAYASVTLGDQNGTLVIKRLPFFLYYKAIDGSTGKPLDPHYFDTFGVSDEYISFSASSYITSPFSYFDPGNSLTRGMKLAAISASNYSYEGIYIPNAVTIGLTSDDLSSSSGFVMNQMYYYSGEGYSPFLQCTVKYGSNSLATQGLFDSGTPGYSYIEDPSAPVDTAQLANGAGVNIATNSGFDYSYTVATNPPENLTYIENPTLTGGQFTDFGIEFFLKNEYMLDYTHHVLGLKNN